MAVLEVFMGFDEASKFASCVEEHKPSAVVLLRRDELLYV